MAMDVLASWPGAMMLDPVDGRHFPVPAFSAEDLETALAPHLWTLVGDRDIVIAQRAIALYARMKADDQGIARGSAAILDESVALPLRLAWFQWLQKQHSARAAKVAVSALPNAAAKLSLAAADHLLDRNLGTSEVRGHVKKVLHGSKDVRALQGALGLLKRLPETEVTLRELITDLRAGKITAPVQLDLIEAARSTASKDKELAALLAGYDAWASQQKPFGKFTVALEGGDAERGKSLFLGHTAAMCSKCHALNQAGQQVGPSLEGVASRLSRAELLESMLDPQARVTPGYGIQTLELKDGSSVTGIQMSETAETIVLRSPDGKQTTYGKADTRSVTKPIGVMLPMKAILSVREMRDLTEFLSTLEN